MILVYALWVGLLLVLAAAKVADVGGDVPVEERTAPVRWLDRRDPVVRGVLTSVGAGAIAYVLATWVEYVARPALAGGTGDQLWLLAQIVIGAGLGLTAARAAVRRDYAVLRTKNGGSA